MRLYKDFHHAVNRHTRGCTGTCSRVCCLFKKVSHLCRDTLFSANILKSQQVSVILRLERMIGWGDKLWSGKERSQQLWSLVLVDTVEVEVTADGPGFLRYDGECSTCKLWSLASYCCIVSEDNATVGLLNSFFIMAIL